MAEVTHLCLVPGCLAVLCRTNENGEADRKLDIQIDENGIFVVCPTCKGETSVRIVTHPGGVEQYVFS